MDATSNGAVSKLVKAWEAKNGQSAKRVAGLGLMAVSLAACNDDSTAVVTPVTPVVVTPVSAALGVGNDTVVGTTGNDSVTGARIDTVQTLNSGDSIALGAGTDSLSANLNAGTVAPTITGVETITLTALGAATVDFVNTTGVTSIVNSASSGDLIVDNVVAIAPVTIQNTSNATTVIFKDAAVAGTTDAVTLNLNNVSGGIITVGGETAGTAGFETINIVATGTNVTGNIAFGTDATVINISGTGSLDIDAGAEFAAAVTVDASGLTGALDIALADRTTTSDTLDLTITTGAGGDTVDISAIVDADVDNITVNLGAGNDRLVLVQAAHNADTGNSMDGGAGTDTLSLGIAMTAVVAAYVSNFETLEFGMTADLAQDMTLADGMNTVSVLDTAAATDDLTLTNVSDGLVLNMNGAALASTSAAGTADIGIVIATLAADTASDDITLNLSASAGGVTVGDFRPDTRYETVTVNSSGTATNQILTVGTAKNNIILAGATGLTLTGTGSLTGVVDASTMTGVFTTTTSTTALTVLGGSGNDVLNSGVVANTVTQTISGGAGNDTITSGNLAAGGTLTVNGDAGSDTITYNAANTGASIHNVNGGAGFDFITLGQHAGTLDDVISTATAVADADKITGFLSGTDDFDYNGTVSNDAATTITAVSNATFAGGLAADVDATVYIVTGSVTGAAATDLTALVAATTVDAIAAAYATFEASLATNLGTITGLDSTLGATESVLLVVDEGTNSIVLRLTNTSTATANTVIASELELVAIMVGNNDLVVGDFI